MSPDPCRGGGGGGGGGDIMSQKTYLRSNQHVQIKKIASNEN